MTDDDHPGEARRYDSAFIGGWKDDRGEWHNVVQGDRPPTSDEVQRSASIRFAVEDDQGEQHWYTTSHLTPDYDLDDVIDDLTTEAGYPGEFV